MGRREGKNHALTIFSERKGGYRTVKRMLDLLSAFLLLVLLSLPLVFIACAVALDSRGGVFFRQVRVGRGGVPFVCIKFRTMYVTAPHDCPACALPEAEKQITRVGRFLRRTSLDELPQLWNVIKGDMSLVGPRPLIPAEGTIHRMREANGVYICRPGLSGLAQISGRNELLDWEKVACDRYYAEHMSFRLDVKILWYTVLRVIEGDGICAEKNKKS